MTNVVNRPGYTTNPNLLIYLYVRQGVKPKKHHVQMFMQLLFIGYFWDNVYLYNLMLFREMEMETSAVNASSPYKHPPRTDA